MVWEDGGREAPSYPIPQIFGIGAFLPMLQSKTRSSLE